jgi:hypothetical protein
MLPHLAREVGEDDVAILELDSEHRVGERLFYLPIDFYGFFFCQKILLGPQSVGALPADVNEARRSSGHREPRNAADGTMFGHRRPRAGRKNDWD